jgi:hypothetical protein
MTLNQQFVLVNKQLDVIKASLCSRAAAQYELKKSAYEKVFGTRNGYDFNYMNVTEDGEVELMVRGSYGGDDYSIDTIKVDDRMEDPAQIELVEAAYISQFEAEKLAALNADIAAKQARAANLRNELERLEQMRPAIEAGRYLRA